MELEKCKSLTSIKQKQSKQIFELKSSIANQNSVASLSKQWLILVVELYCVGKIFNLELRICEYLGSSKFDELLWVQFGGEM